MAPASGRYSSNPPAGPQAGWGQSERRVPKRQVMLVDHPRLSKKKKIDGFHPNVGNGGDGSLDLEPVWVALPRQEEDRKKLGGYSC